MIDNNNVSRIRSHRIEVQSNKDKTMATNELNVSGGTANAEASIKKMNKITVISRAIQDEKHATAVFGINKSALSATFGQSSVYTYIYPGNLVWIDDNNYMYLWIGKLSLAANALPRTSYFLDRLSYTHAILGEAVYLISS